MRSSGKVIASCLTAFSDAFREPSLTTWSAFANRGHCDLRLTPLKNPSMGWLANGGSRLLVRRAARAEQIDLFIDKSLTRLGLPIGLEVELTVDAMELARQLDQMVLFSGDGDFRSLVEAVQRRGVRVTVVSTISSQPPMIADELRRQADAFIDLAALRLELGRNT